MNRITDAVMDRLERMAEWYLPVNPAPGESARGLMRAGLTGLGLLGGAAVLLVIANGEKVVPETDTPSFTVGSGEGDIRCTGSQAAFVTSTISEAVAESTIFVGSNVSYVTPDLLPVVTEVLERNGIVDATKVPSGAVIQIPNFCTFAP